MKNEDLGNRMKNYESCFDYRLPSRMAMIVRVDGKTFHTMTRKWKCVKPYDSFLRNTMIHTATELCGKISGTVIGYQQSDEISMVVKDDMTIGTTPMFDKRIQKLCSVTASMASVAFNQYGMEHNDNVKNNPAIFDCRVFILPDYEIRNYLLWRQMDASRNSIQMLAQSLYSHKQLLNMKSKELQEMCFQKGHNWNDVETSFKRGVCFFKKPVEKIGHLGQTVVRNAWFADMDMPEIMKNFEYIENF